MHCATVCIRVFNFAIKHTRNTTVRVASVKQQQQKPKRGRPLGPQTVRFSALLFPEQLEVLELLSKELEGKPPVAGLLRSAVQAYIEAKLKDKGLRERVEERRRAGIALVR